MSHLKILKEWAEDKNVLLVEFEYGGVGLYDKGYSPSGLSDYRIIGCDTSKCEQNDCWKIWDVDKKEWVNLCSACLDKVWPQNE